MQKRFAYGVFFLLAVLTFLFYPSAPKLAPSTAFAQVGPGGYSLVALQNSGDPCQNPNVTKKSAAIAITSATTTEIVAASAGKTVYACKFQMSVVGTSPTVQLETGTKTSTACDTGAATLSGAFAIPTTTLFSSVNGNEAAVVGATSGEFCLVTGGTITGVEGYLTYVQQ